jgi:hypothetical protein
MADHRATWVRLRAVARQRYPDDDMAAEAATRALFDKEEKASYAAELDARAEEQKCPRHGARRHAPQGRAPRGTAGGGLRYRRHRGGIRAPRRRRPGHGAPKRAPIGILSELGGDGRAEGVSGRGRAEGGSGGRRPREDRTTVEAERRLQYERARAAELAAMRQHQYPLPSYFADAGNAEDVERRRLE